MRPTRTDFRDRSAIVTGGASGIGRALAGRLRDAGAHVVLADVDEAVHRVADEVESAAANGGSARGVVLDVRNRAAVQALVDEVVHTHGQLDLMFNNAGISLGGPTEELPGEYWDRIIDVNLGGVVNGVLAAYPGMVASGRGHIVNTASAAGLLPAPFATAYTTTKHAVVGLSTALRAEAAAHGVQVSVLCPGMVETPILDSTPPGDLPAGARSTLTGRQYLETGGMSPMSPDDLARRALRAVARNRAIIVIPAKVRAGWLLGRLSPGLIDAFGRYSARKVRTEMERIGRADP